MSNYFQEMDNAYKDIINSAWNSADVKTPKADGDYQVSIIESKLAKSRKGVLFQYFSFLFQEGDYKNQTLDKWFPIDTKEYNIERLKNALAAIAPDLPPIDDISILDEEDFQAKLVDRVVTIRLKTNDKGYQNLTVLSYDGMNFQETDEALPWEE